MDYVKNASKYAPVSRRNVRNLKAGLKHLPSYDNFETRGDVSRYRDNVVELLNELKANRANHYMQDVVQDELDVLNKALTSYGTGPQGGTSKKLTDIAWKSYQRLGKTYGINKADKNQHKYAAKRIDHLKDATKYRLKKTKHAKEKAKHDYKIAQARIDIKEKELHKAMSQYEIDQLEHQAQQAESKGLDDLVNSYVYSILFIGGGAAYCIYALTQLIGKKELIDASVQLSPASSLLNSNVFTLVIGLLLLGLGGVIFVKTRKHKKKTIKKKAKKTSKKRKPLKKKKKK